MVFYLRAKSDLESTLKFSKIQNNLYVKSNAKGSAKTSKVSSNFELVIFLSFISAREIDKKTGY